MVAIVTMVSDVNCTTGRPVPVTQSHGLLASVVTERTRLGSADCPWLIDAVSGQTITVHLYDFGSVQRQNDSSLQLHPANTVSRASLSLVTTMNLLRSFHSDAHTCTANTAV